MTKDFIYFWPHITSREGAKERANWVLRPIKRYNKKAKKVLELGVGIGQVIVNFPKRFDIFGLDYEKKYINYCRRKIKRGKFFVSSMHNFKINDKFDVIFSVYDSINFLKNFDQWKSTFRTVNKHLNDDGLFIFDMYTPKILKDFKEKEATASRFSKGYIHDWSIIKGNNLTWDFKVFERIKKDTYKINEYKWKEVIHPVPKVKSALSKHFKILKTKLMEEDRRILFICRKIQSL